MTDTLFSRRHFLAGAAAASGTLLAGCQTQTPPPDAQLVSGPGRLARTPLPGFGRDSDVPSDEDSSGPGIDWASAYAGRSDGGFALPPIPWEKVPSEFRRQIVANTTGEGPGKLVVQTRNHHLFYTLPRGRAVRYGVGLGREGFEWSGRGTIKRKAEWPRWHPPEEMIERQPELEKYRTTYNRKTDTWEGGMGPGLMNPLGARALYIYQGDVDTQYRLHGSPEWWSIGKSVSSGCVRLINQDVIDLYRRVPEGTEVIVR